MRIDPCIAGLEGARLVMEPVKAPRRDWLRDYDSARDIDAWDDLPLDADVGDWEW